jgi:drug/metabolite transporter (DMT)-like permease
MDEGRGAGMTKPTIRIAPRLAVVILIFTSAAWGSAFTVMKDLLPDVSAAGINLGRFAIASVALLPFARFEKKLWLAGSELGVWLFAGYASQTLGVHYTTINRCAFITAMNVVFVPIIASFFGQSARLLVWFAAVLALGGCGLLSWDNTGGPNAGDLWSLVTAVTFALYIVRMEAIARRFRPLPLAFAQVVPIALLSLIWFVFTPMPSTHFHLGALLYLGLVATAATTLLQALGQRAIPAPQAAVIFTLEPVFAVIFGYLILGEVPTPRGAMGAVMIIVAAILSQMPGWGEEARETSTVHVAG